MTHVLKMFELANQYRVTKMQIGSSGIEAGLYSQGLAGLCRLLKASTQFRLADDLHRALFQIRELLFDGRKAQGHAT